MGTGKGEVYLYKWPHVVYRGDEDDDGGKGKGKEKGRDRVGELDD